MNSLDLQVVQQAQQWLEQGRSVCLSTVLSTYGSAPRGPGAMLVALADGRFCGSLSGGCVEDDFLERLGRNEFGPENQVVRYGEGGLAPSLKLPCGGVLDVLVEQFVPGCEALEHFSLMLQALQGQQRIIRAVSLDTLNRTLDICSAQGSTVEVSERQIAIRIGAARRLLIAGLSPVAEFCASFAVSLGYEVIVCDPAPSCLLALTSKGSRLSSNFRRLSSPMVAATPVPPSSR